MAKESSFDVVSSADIQEVDNAYQQAKKELTQRYDLKDSGSSISFDKQAKTLTVKAPSDFVAGQVTDIMIHSNYLQRTKERLNKILSANTGKPYEEVVAACERDNFLSPQEALEFGLIDRVLDRH